MVSRLVGSVIANLLNDKIENLDSNQLNVSLLSGNLELRDLKIRQSILDEVNLPIVLQKGVVGKISVSVPWLNISAQPSVFTIDDVFLLCGPQTRFYVKNTKFSKESYQDAQQRDKNAKLRKYEEVKELERSGRPEFSKGAMASAISSPDKTGESLTARLVQIILRNIQVCINRIHVRYEDVAPVTGNTYAFGFVLEGLKVSSSASSPSYDNSSDSSNTLFKNVDLRSLAVYIDPHAERPLSKRDLDSSEIVDAMKNAVSYTRQGTGERVHPLKSLCILGPIDAKAKLAITAGFKKIDLAVPMCSVECVFPTIDLSLSEPQFHVAAALSDLVVQYGKTIGNLQYRPRVPVSENPRAWFQYAGRAVVREVAERRRRTSFKYLIQRARTKDRYIELFKRYRQVRWLKPLTRDERDELEDMEKSLSAQDIIFFRTIADNILDKEALVNMKIEELKPPPKEESKPAAKKGGGGGWFSWLWGGGGGNSTSQEEQHVVEDNEDVKLSKEELDEINRLVGYEEAYDAISPPPDYVKMSMMLKVDSVRVSLRSNKTDIVVLNLENVLTNFAVRETNMALQIRVGSISADDFVTEDTKFPKALSFSGDDSCGDHFMDLRVEVSPLDKHADSVVTFKMKSVNVVLSHVLFKRLSLFFTPTTHVSVTALKKLTTDKLWNLVEASRIQLERVVQEHKSPKLVVPQNPEKSDSALLVLDLGKLVMVSCKKEKSFEMYDKYNVNLIDFSALIQSPHAEASKIVEKFSLAVDIFSSIVPNELSLPTLMISSEIVSAKVNLSIQSILALNRFRRLFATKRDPESAAQSAADEANSEQEAIEYKQLTIEQITKAQSYLDEVERLSKEHVDKKTAFLKMLADHVVMNAEFKIGEADLALLDEVNVPIADFTVRKIALSYIRKTFSTEMEASVGAVDIGNTLFYREKQELPYLATSKKDGEKRDVLATVRVESFEKGTPVYKKVDNSVDIKFNYFYLIVVPEVFTKILNFIKYIGDEKDQYDKEKQKIVKSEDVIIRSQKNDYVKVDLRLNAGTLGIIFVDEQTTRRIAEFSITGIKSDVTINENGAAKVLFELYSIGVQDLAVTPEALESLPSHFYERIVAPQDSSKAVVRAEVTTNLLLDDGWAGEEEVGAKVVLTVEPLNVVLMPSFIRELKNYFTKTIFFQALKKEEFMKMEMALIERDIDPTRRPSKSLVSVTIKAPRFILPKNYKSGDYLTMSFSSISARNIYYVNSKDATAAASVANGCCCASSSSITCVTSEFQKEGELLERMDVVFSGVSLATSLDGKFCSIAEDVSFDVNTTKSGNNQYNVFPVTCVCFDFKPISLALSNEQFEFLVTFALNVIVIPNFDWVFFLLDLASMYGLTKPSKRQRVELALSAVSADFKKHYLDIPFARLIVYNLGINVLKMLNGKIRTEFVTEELKLRAAKDDNSGYQMVDCVDLNGIVKVVVELTDIPIDDYEEEQIVRRDAGSNNEEKGDGKKDGAKQIMTEVMVNVEIVEIVIHIPSLAFMNDLYLGFLVKNLSLLRADPNSASDLDENGYSESSRFNVKVKASLKNSEIYAPKDDKQNELLISGEEFTLEIDTDRKYAIVKSKNSFAMINDKKVIEPFDCSRLDFDFVDDIILNVALDINDLTCSSPVGGITLIASSIRFIFSLLLILFNPFSAHSPDEESDSDITFTCIIPNIKFFVTYDNDNSYESQFCLLRATGTKVTVRELIKSIGEPGTLERVVDTTFTVDSKTEVQVDFFNQAFAWFEPILEPTSVLIKYDENNNISPVKNNIVNKYAISSSIDSQMRLNVTIPFVRGIERIYLSLLGVDYDAIGYGNFLSANNDGGSNADGAGGGVPTILTDKSYTSLLKAAAGKGGADAAAAAAVTGEKLSEEEILLLNSYEDIDIKKGETKTVILNKTGYPLSGYFFYEKILPSASTAAAAAAAVVSFAGYGNKNVSASPFSMASSSRSSFSSSSSASSSLSSSSSSSSNFSRINCGSELGVDEDDYDDMEYREKFNIEPYTGWNPYFVTFGNNTRAKPYSLFKRQTNNIIRVARINFTGTDLKPFNLCLDKAGVTLHRIPGIDPVVAEVKWVEEYKCKIIIVRSCFQIVNTTNHKLDAIIISDLHPELPPHVMKLKPNVTKPVPIGFSVESKVRLSIRKSKLYGQSLECVSVSSLLSGERFSYTCLPYDPLSPSTRPLYFCAYGKKFVMNALSAVSSNDQQQQSDQSQYVNSDEQSLYRQGLSQLGLDQRTFIGTMVIMPPIVVVNTIPYPCQFVAYPIGMERAKKGAIRFSLEKGESTGLCNFDPRTTISLAITNIGNATVAKIFFEAYTMTQGVYTVEARTPGDFLMPVKISMIAKHIPVRTYTFSVPYWIVNKTGIDFMYGYDRIRSLPVSTSDTEARPYIFSNDLLDICTCMMSRQGKWAKDIPLDKPDPSDIEIRSPDESIQYSIRIVSEPGKKPSAYSRIVTISPRYVFVNRIHDCVVSLKQTGRSDAAKISLGYNDYKDFHWNVKASSRSFVDLLKGSFDRSFVVSLKFAANDSSKDSVEYSWAGPFEIGTYGEYTIRMTAPRRADYFLRYEIVDAKYSTFILFKEMKDLFIPYKIENDSGFHIVAYQEASSSRLLGEVIVNNNATRNFGWIRPLSKQVLAIRFPTDPPTIVRYNPDKIVRFKEITLGDYPPIYNYIRVAGYTRVLVLTTNYEKYLSEGEFLDPDSSIFSGSTSSFFSGRHIGSAALMALPFMSDENAKRKKRKPAYSSERELPPVSENGDDDDDDDCGSGRGSNSNSSRSYGNYNNDASEDCPGSPVNDDRDDNYIVRLRDEQEAEDLKRMDRMQAKKPPPGGRCELDVVNSVHIDISVRNIEASIITPEPRELAVLTLLGANWKSEITASTFTAEVSVGYIQVDDQNFESVYPVPLVGLPAKETGRWMVAEIVKSRLHDSIDYYKYFSVNVAPLNVRLNIDFALRMYSYVCALELEVFAMRKSSKKNAPKQQDDDEEASGSSKAKLTPWEAENENICKNRDVINDRMLYFQVFRLNPLKVYISLSNKRTADADFLHNYLVEAVLKILDNIENVPYNFNPVLFRNCFSAKSKFVLAICYGYLTQIVKHPGKLLGYTGSAGNTSFVRKTFGYGFEEVFRSAPTERSADTMELVSTSNLSPIASELAFKGGRLFKSSSEIRSRSSSMPSTLYPTSGPLRSAPLSSSSLAFNASMSSDSDSTWQFPLPDNLVRIPNKSLLVSRVHFYPRVFGMGGRLIKYQEVVFKLMYTIKEFKYDVCVWNKVYSVSDDVAKKKSSLVCFVTDKRFMFYEVGAKTRMEIVPLDHSTWALNNSSIYYVDEKDSSVHTYNLLDVSVANEAFAVIKALNAAKLMKITPPEAVSSPDSNPYSNSLKQSSSTTVVSTIIAY